MCIGQAEIGGDFFVVYHQEYDDQLHNTRPFSPECLRLLDNHVRSLQRLAHANPGSRSQMLCCRMDFRMMRL